MTKVTNQKTLPFNFNPDRYVGFCRICGREVTKRVAEFSQKTYGLIQCYSCQRKGGKNYGRSKSR